MPTKRADRQGHDAEGGEGEKGPLGQPLQYSL